MKNLLVYLPGLTRLELVDLELDGVDGKDFSSSLTDRRGNGHFSCL